MGHRRARAGRGAARPALPPGGRDLRSDDLAAEGRAAFPRHTEAVPMTVTVERVRTTPWTWRGPALLAYALAFGTGVVLIGVPTDPFQLFGWLWLATIAFNVRAPWRSHLAFP